MDLKESEFADNLVKMLATKNSRILEDTLDELVTSVEKRLSEVSSRMNKIKEILDHAFPSETKAHERGTVIAFIWVFMHNPLVLYSLNMNSSAIVELHAILERLLISSTAKQLAISSRLEYVEKLLDRKSLPDLAQILCELEILDDTDVVFTQKLNRLRNGIAHKNLEIISKTIHGGKELDMWDVANLLDSYDITHEIVKAFDVFLKIYKSIVDPDAVKNLIQELHQDGRISDEDFCELEKAMDEQFKNKL